jgi:hypothetical protein
MSTIVKHKQILESAAKQMGMSVQRLDKALELYFAELSKNLAQNLAQKRKAEPKAGISKSDTIVNIGVGSFSVRAYKGDDGKNSLGQIEKAEYLHLCFNDSEKFQGIFESAMADIQNEGI